MKIIKAIYEKSKNSQKKLRVLKRTKQNKG